VAAKLWGKFAEDFSQVGSSRVPASLSSYDTWQVRFYGTGVLLDGVAAGVVIRGAVTFRKLAEQIADLVLTADEGSKDWIRFSVWFGRS
jgi:hypothetical protein